MAKEGPIWTVEWFAMIMLDIITRPIHQGSIGGCHVTSIISPFHYVRPNFTIMFLQWNWSLPLNNEWIAQWLGPHLLVVQHDFENSPLMVFFHWSFLQANLAMTANYDINVPMLLELNFLDFEILQFHPMKVAPNFQLSFFFYYICMVNDCRNPRNVHIMSKLILK